MAPHGWSMIAAAPPAATAYLPQVLMVVGVVCIGVLLVYSIRGKIAARNAERPSARAQIDAIKARRAEAGETTDGAVRLVETASRLAAQLDVKAERLEQLLDHADVVIQSLEAELHRAAPARAEPAPPRAAPLDPLTRSVYELADAGHEPIEIARRLDEQIGKVELILALRGG